MGNVEEAAAMSSVVEKLGFNLGDLVQEFGYDDDVDFDFRNALEGLLGAELLDEDAQEVVDGVVLWWRDDDGDLVDALVDVLATLKEDGQVWILIPKPARAGHVSPSVVQEAAPVAGLHTTSSFNACKDWLGTRLMSRKNKG